MVKFLKPSVSQFESGWVPFPIGNNSSSVPKSVLTYLPLSICISSTFDSRPHKPQHWLHIFSIRENVQSHFPITECLAHIDLKIVVPITLKCKKEESAKRRRNKQINIVYFVGGGWVGPSIYFTSLKCNNCLYKYWEKWRGHQCIVIFNLLITQLLVDSAPPKS